MKVIAIYEENHGMIKVASSKRAAANFLISDNWFGPYDEIWVRSERKSYPAYELLGKKIEDVWFEDLVNLLLESIEHEDRQTCFMFREEEVWEE